MTWPVTPDPGIHTNPDTSGASSTNSLTGLRQSLLQLPLTIIELVLQAVIGALENVPVIGPLLTPALTQLSNVFTNLFSLFGVSGSSLTGNPASFSASSALPSNAANIPILGPILAIIGDIPVIGPLVTDLIALFSQFLGGGGTSTSNSSLTGLAGLLNNIPLIGPLVAALTGSSGGGIVGIVEAPLTFLESFFGGLFGFLGSPSLGGGTASGGGAAGGAGNTDTYGYTLQDLLGLVGTNNTLPPNMLAGLSATGGPNVLSDDFYQWQRINGQGGWVWDWPGPDTAANSWGTGAGCVRTIRPGVITIYNVEGTWEAYLPGQPAAGYPKDPKVWLEQRIQDMTVSGLGATAAPTGVNRLDLSRANVVNVPYPGALYPMGWSVNVGTQTLINMINSTPGKFILMGNSMGGVVVSNVYDELRSGSLQNRNQDLVMGWCQGNPRKEQGRGFPGPDGRQTVACSGGRGCVDPNLVGTEDRWWEVSVGSGPLPGYGTLNGVNYPNPDPISCLGDDTIGQETRAVVAQTMSATTYGANTSSDFQNAIGGDFSSPTLGAGLNYLLNVAFNLSASPHGNGYMEWQPFLASGDTRTAFEYGLDAMNALLDTVVPPAVGEIRELEGIPVAVKPYQEVTFSAQTEWLNVTATGPAIMLAVNAYDASNHFITQVTTPVATISDPASESDWITLRADFVMPDQAAWARPAFWVSAQAANTGTVWFAEPSFEVDSMIWGPMLDVDSIPQLDQAKMQGPQGIADLFTGWANVIDGLASANANQQMSGVQLQSLFESQGAVALNAENALNTTIAHETLLQNVSVLPLSTSMEPTAEATIPLTAFGGTLPSYTLAAGDSLMGFINCAQGAKKTFVEFLANGSGATGIYVNVYSVDKTTGNMSLKWASADISGVVPNGTWNWVTATMPTNQMSVAASDLVALEIVTQTASLNIAAPVVPWPNRAGGIPPNLGASRATASTGGVAPPSLTSSQMSYGSTVPFISFGGTNLGGTQPAEAAVFAAGVNPYAVPVWMQQGDWFDVVILPGGGGGGTRSDGNTGQGGLAGPWLAETLVYGTDVPLTTNNLTVTVGTGGAAGASGSQGADGGVSSVSGTGVTTLTAAGGYGGGLNLYQFFDAADGSGAQNYTNGGTSLTATYTHRPSGTPTAIVVYAVVDQLVSPGVTVTATYGGHAMTLLSGGAALPNGDGTFSGLYAFGLLAPPSGWQDVVVAATASVSTTFCIQINGASYVGASAFGPPSTANASLQTQMSMTAASAPGQFVSQAFMSFSAAGFTPGLAGGYNQTVRFNQKGDNFGSARYLDWMIGDAPGESSVTFTTTNNVSGGVAWQGVAIPLLPSGTGNTNSTSTGIGPVNDMFHATTYFGGHDVASGPGASPGGGGGGGSSSTPAGKGADGQVWITARQQS